MAPFIRMLLVLGATLGAVSAASAADEARFAFGGDSFAAGQAIAIDQPVAGDVYATGNVVTVSAGAGGNVHAAGANVRLSGPIGGDLYAAGYSVTVDGTVAGGITAAGRSVTVATTTPVGGNVRLAGQNLTLDSAIEGTALVSGQTLVVNGTIAGDLSFFGESISFGPQAAIGGRLEIHSREAITVPERVAAADRVTQSRIEGTDYFNQMGRTIGQAVGAFALWGAIGSWVLLLVIGAAFLAFAPRGSAALVAASERSVFRRLGLGIVGLAAVIGLVPVLAMTVIGLILVPFALMFIGISWALAFLAGSTLAGLRIAGRFLSIDSNGRTLAVLAVSVTAAMLLGGVPFVGWLIGLGLTLFGFGCIGTALLARRDRAA